jgi:hypothetical protein
MLGVYQRARDNGRRRTYQQNKHSKIYSSDLIRPKVCSSFLTTLHSRRYADRSECSQRTPLPSTNIRHKPTTRGHHDLLHPDNVRPIFPTSIPTLAQALARHPEQRVSRVGVVPPPPTAQQPRLNLPESPAQADTDAVLLRQHFHQQSGLAVPFAGSTAGTTTTRSSARLGLWFHSDREPG